MLRSKTRTQGRKYPRHAYWIQQRNKIFERAGGICEISGDDLFSVKHGEDCTDNQCATFDDGYCKFSWRRAVDHIIPERAAHKMYPGCDVHCLENLVCVTSAIHAKKTAVERRIYSGDWIGYCMELRRIGFSQWMIDKALKALYASAKEKNDLKK